MQGTITKSELADMYGFSIDTLKRYLNKVYFEELKAVGYNKNQQILTPKILTTFFDLFGAPLKDDLI